jgi:hypothetical protein
VDRDGLRVGDPTRIEAARSVNPKQATFVGSVDDLDPALLVICVDVADVEVVSGGLVDPEGEVERDRLRRRRRTVRAEGAIRWRRRGGPQSGRQGGRAGHLWAECAAAAGAGASL